MENIKLWGWVVWNQRFKWKIKPKILKDLYHKKKKKKTFFLCMYKIYKVTAETFDKNCIHTIKVNKTDNKSVLWIKLIDIKKKLNVKNIHDLVNKEMKTSNPTDEQIVKHMDQY